MKFLLDQNLSRRLVEPLAALWPGTSHVSLHNLDKATDQDIWDFCQEYGYCIISKDSDFLNLALLKGAPPKAIILRMGNSSTAELERCLIVHQSIIEAFYRNLKESVLVLP